MEERGKGQHRSMFFAVAGIILLLLAAVAYYVQGQERVLRIGVFAGNNWGVPQGNSYAVLDEAVEEFQKEHPGIRVEYVSGIKKEDYAEWLAEQVMGGREPDVFFVLSDDFNLYASMGALMELSSFMEEDRDFQTENYYKAALDYGKYEDQPYALPCAGVPTLMFVNKSLLAREGIPMPGDDWTWKDFLGICRRVTRDTDGDGVLDQFGCYD
ncbi:MAG: extracellular solute-binding protein [Selenomonadaceae bacterium]|nr:extracellular solute-binding protein [Selenomonadaceae bacterium]